GFTFQTFDFSSPVSVSDSFALAVTRPSSANDTLYMLTDDPTQGDGGGFGLAGRLNNSGTWESELNDYGNDMDYLIEPVIEHKHDADFTATPQEICVGDSVKFTNKSVLATGFMFNTLHPLYANGTGNFYNWNFGNGETSNAKDTTITYNTAGNKSVLLLDSLTTFSATTCWDTAISTINVYKATAQTATPDSFSCAVDSVMLADSASSTTSGNGVTYYWSRINGGNITSGQNDDTAWVDGPGEYVLTVEDSVHGCADMDTVTVPKSYLVPNASIVNQGQDTLTCNVTSTTLDGSNSSTQSSTITFNWTTTNGNIQTDAGSQIIVDDAGIYTLTVNDPVNNCSDDTTYEIFIDTTKPTTNIADPDTFFCTTDSLMLDGSASTSSTGSGLDFKWSSISGGNITSGMNNDTAWVDGSGSYELLVTDKGNGCTDEDTADVAQETSVPTAVIDNPTPSKINCYHPTDTLDATGSSTATGKITWSWEVMNGGNIFDATSDSSMVFIDSGGEYVLTVTDTGNGCEATTLYGEPMDTSSPTADIVKPDTFKCNSDSILLDGSNSTPPMNITYKWVSINGGSIISGQGTDSAWVDASGDYKLIVQDTGNGCTDTAMATVPKDSDVPTVNISNPSGLDTFKCNTAMNTTLDGSSSSVTSGTPDFQWSTNNGNITSGTNDDSVDVDAPGSYMLTVTDTSNGCSNTGSYTIYIDTTAPNAMIDPMMDTLNCTTSSLTLDGSISTPSNISYMWSTNNGNITSSTTNSSITLDATGDYQLVVTDKDNGCKDTASATIKSDYSAADASLRKNDTTICNDQGTIDLDNFLSNNANTSGNWNDIDGSGGLSGSIFDPAQADSNTTFDFVYHVSVGSCDNYDTLAITNDVCTDIRENDKEETTIKTYPNPAKTNITFELNNSSARSIEIYDLTGQKLKDINTNSEDNLKVVDLNEVDAGMYIYQVKDEEGTIISTDKFNVLK
ncbi:MAG: T9SS type A sorting domain-containing protein, partial [Flavobacteriales bacterium]